MSSRRPLLVRAYAALLALLPPGLRDELGSEAAALFEELYRDARVERGRLGAAALWARCAAQAVACAVSARREARVEVRSRPTRPARFEGGREAMGGWVHDARLAARALARGPGFALTAVLILGTGIGATTTIFSVVDAIVLEPLPYPESGRLVHFDNGAHSYPNFHAWQELESFELIAAARDHLVDLTGEGPPERIPAAAVSEDFFRLFGGAPHLGRLFGPGDYPGDRSVAVLGHGFWTRLGGSDERIGSTLTIDGRPTTVIGVLAPDFEPPALQTGARVDLWLPLDDGGAEANSHGFHVLGVAGRLRPDVSLEAAQNEIDAERLATAELFPRYYVSDGVTEMAPLVELHDATVQRVSGMLFMLLGSVGMMLLIACANVANLFLARGTTRHREIALRGALGASRARIAGQILSESVLLSLAGGALGVALAFVGVEGLARFMPPGMPRVDGLGVDLRVLAFTVLVSVLTGVLFGMLPALQALRENVSEALKEGARSASSGRRGRRVRSGLVVTEVALAVVLVAGAGLLLRSLLAMIRVEPGFERENLVVLPLRLDAGYDELRREQFTRELLATIEALPGAEAVAAGWTLPFTFTGRGRCCWRTRVVGDPTLSSEDDPYRSLVHPVTDGYFAALGAPLLAGREFEADDERPVAILNAPTARGLFGTADPVGRTIRLGGEELEVIGVVEGVHHFGLDQGVERAVYVRYLRHGPDQELLEVAVRTERSASAMAPALRDAVWAIDPDLPVETVTTMEARIGSSLAEPRFLSGLLGGFALVALILACGGIYGSMLYTVGQRRHEMGIRLALGAAGSDVIGLVLRQGAVLAATGVLLGTVAGLALSGVMRRLVWGVQPTDPVTFVGAALLLGATAVFASLLPAWRAARTDPLGTLRAE